MTCYQLAVVLGLRPVTVKGYLDGRDIPLIVENFMRLLLSAGVASGHIAIAEQKVRELWTT